MGRSRQSNLLSPSDESSPSEEVQEPVLLRYIGNSDRRIVGSYVWVRGGDPVLVTDSPLAQELAELQEFEVIIESLDSSLVPEEVEGESAEDDLPITNSQESLPLLD